MSRRNCEKPGKRRGLAMQLVIVSAESRVAVRPAVAREAMADAAA